MKIIIDAFGGDHAPLEVLKGAADAVKAYPISIVLTGDEKKIRETAKENGVSLDKMEIVNAGQVMPMEAEPTQILKAYQDSSMAVGLKLLAEGGGDAFVSAGSTGALLAGATFLVKRIKGVKRPAIGTMVPNGENRAYLLIDSGANAECRPEMLVQFALMGSVYCEQVAGIEKPRVALINNGVEEHKGGPLQQETHALLKAAPLHYIGSIEAREVPLGGCDVAVADGFTGNVVLKLTEGLAKFFNNELKGMLLQSAKTKLAAFLLKDGLTRMKKMLDYREHGGAPLLGVKKPVVKAHGSSTALAFENAIRQAMFCVQKDIAGEIAAGMAKIKSDDSQE